MKKKGFTLIELLAIIVILAIIAVITVPIILNIIENSRKGAAIDSAYGYKDAISKYYITELAKDPNYGELNGTYTVTEEGKLTLEDETIEISFSGTSPKGGNLTIDKGTVTKGCLTIGDYALTLSNNEVTETKKGDCNSLVQGDEPQEECNPEIAVKFDEDTDWSDIVTAVRNGQTCGMNVGDTKKITLTGEEFSGKEYTLRIANTTTPEECKGEGFSQTACGFVLEFADIITKHEMNPDETEDGINEGGWKDSEMRKYLNCSNGESIIKDDTDSQIDCSSMSETSIYDSLPESLKSAIIDTRVVSGHVAGDSVNFTTTDKIYLLATAEIWENGSSNIIEYDTARDNTRQLDYYAQDPKTTTDDGEGRKKPIKEYNGEATYWWSRSALFNGSNTFFGSTGGGDWSSVASRYAYGVAPAFRIGQ